MNKKIIKAVVLVILFLVSLVGLSLLTDTNHIDLTSEMPEATLPVIYIQKDEIYINEMFGYKGEMNELSIRERITPLSEDMRLSMMIQTFQTHVEGISYEVRTMDMERLLESTQINDYTQSDGIISKEFTIQNLLEEGEEYRLIITLKCEGEDVRYYTRIMRSEGYHVEDSIQFALDFHKKTFDASEAARLATYLEPDSQGDNTTLQKVTIHSSLSQVAWGSFEGEVLKEPVLSVEEINSSYNTIILSYVMGATGQNGETEFYNVEEYYRVRYSTNRIFLLNYERTMNEIFRGSGNHISKTAISLGIRDLDVSYMANENGTIISFVQEGDLWSYNIGTNQLSLVYGFRGIEGINDRENNQNHEIRIMKVNEAGSIDFVVYGYMNRGIHEGYTGIGVYHFDSVANTIQEELFIQSKEPYQILKETWAKLFYVGGEGNFYMLAEDTLYKVQLGDYTVQEMCTDLEEENFAVSADGRYIAWREKDAKNKVIVTDLDSENQWQIESGASDILIPVGFVESDFVYGIAEQKGEMHYAGLPMYKIVIVDKEKQIIKEYEKAGYYVTDAYVEGSTVFLERAVKNGDFYVSVESDAIKSHEVEASRDIQIVTNVTEQKQTQVSLRVERELSTKRAQVLTPKEVVLKEQNTVTLEGLKEKEHYTVYAVGKVILCTGNVIEAVRTADDYAGVVIGDNYRYIWQRSRRSSKSLADQVILSQENVANTSDITARCLMAMLQTEGISFDVGGLINEGRSPDYILQEAMPSAQVLDLTGCTVAQILYYIDQGGTVFAIGENQQPLLIAGYDEHNTILYDPETNTTYKKGLQDSEAYFTESGNVFIGYLNQGNRNTP